MRLSLMAAALTLTVIIAGCAGSQRIAGEPYATHTATIRTTMGDITLELYGEDAPRTVANFAGLAERDFYEGILFHRIVPGFVIQAGDPLTKDPSKKEQWGQGGESIYDGTFADELDTASLSYQRGYIKGAVAMANAGPNTNTSQFFIMLDKNPRLPKNYTIFGKVVEGMDVVEAIGQLEREPGSERAKVPPVITDVVVRKT